MFIITFKSKWITLYDTIINVQILLSAAGSKVSSNYAGDRITKFDSTFIHSVYKMSYGLDGGKIVIALTYTTISLSHKNVLQNNFQGSLQHRFTCHFTNVLCSKLSIEYLCLTFKKVV